MTVESTARKQTYAGGQADHTFTFRAFPDYPEDVKCLKTLISTGAETDLTYTTEYTVDVADDGIGGVVTVNPTVSTLYTVTVYRVTTDKQESDYDDYNQFPADTLEQDLDRRTMISQERGEDSDRTLKLSISTSGVDATLPTPVADQVLGWNSGATAIENKNVVTLGAITLDTDGTLAANSDSKVPSQKATKTYADTKAEEGVWSDYFATSTIVGWAAGKTGTIYTKKVGKTVFIDFLITGTGTGSTTSFTLPYAGVGGNNNTLIYAINNGGAADAGATSLGATNVVTLYPTLALGSWTDGGTRTVTGQFFVMTA